MQVSRMCSSFQVAGLIVTYLKEMAFEKPTANKAAAGTAAITAREKTTPSSMTVRTVASGRNRAALSSLPPKHAEGDDKRNQTPGQHYSNLIRNGGQSRAVQHDRPDCFNQRGEWQQPDERLEHLWKTSCGEKDAGGHEHRQGDQVHKA